METYLPPFFSKLFIISWIYPPPRIPVTTRIITFLVILVGNPYKPSLSTVTGWGLDPNHKTKGLNLHINWELLTGNMDSRLRWPVLREKKIPRFPGKNPRSDGLAKLLLLL